ncbi:hypothetical protein FD33_GL001958 [Companilactobacillus paralimentarius DSM 13238 = JCM 10415]|uniref:HTH hxlR-type domain-containing protein n=2 Tax=Companilactobacillus paralimentarius TaxID=83526 RepID=A0A0R1PND9_9LACO|nr:hypothetical protein FD33_GL001958 [Companilactobacillus paralimentarius DSM 13238 = JCM 10415]
MLALQLNDLEQDGIIKKTIYQVKPLRTDYQLTEFGRTLEPVIEAMTNWGSFYNQKKASRT